MKISKKFNKKSGIYCIKNIINNKNYIGSSIDIRGRLQMHRALLRKNAHNNHYLQNSWNKHGEDRFVCFILELCAAENLLIREEYFIGLLGDYNITKEATRNVPSKESREKHSKTKKELHLKGLLPKTVKPITQYSLQGEKLRDWDSITSASKELGIHPTTIIRCLDGTFKQGKGFLWKYLNQDAPDAYKKDRKVIYKNTRSKKVIFTSEDEVLEFDSFKLATIYFDKSFQNLYQYYKKGMIFMKKYKIDLIKSDKLLENPNEGNQQPI